jgi:hypothetical protein
VEAIPCPTGDGSRNGCVRSRCARARHRSRRRDVADQDDEPRARDNGGARDRRPGFLRPLGIRPGARTVAGAGLGRESACAPGCDRSRDRDVSVRPDLVGAVPLVTLDPRIRASRRTPYRQTPASGCRP